MDVFLVFDEGIFKEDPEGARNHMNKLLDIMESADPATMLSLDSILLEIFQSIWLRVAKVFGSLFPPFYELFYSYTNNRGRLLAYTRGLSIT